MRAGRRAAATPAALAALAALLSGCTDDEEPRLAGAREPLRSEAEAAAGAAEIRPIPDARPVEAWTHPGGDAARGGGHVAAPTSLTLAWRVDAGSASGDRVPTSRPVIAEGRVHVRDGRAGVLSFDAASGRRLWEADLTPEDDEREDGFGGGVAVLDGRLFATTGFGEVVAMDPATGEVFWRAGGDAPFRSGPAAFEGVAVAVNRAMEAVAFDAETGERLWRSDSGMTRQGNLAGAGPAMAAGVTIAPFGSGELQLLRTARGSRLWTGVLISPVSAEGLAAFPDIASAPAIARTPQGAPIIVAGNAGGAFAGFEGSSGRRLWQRGVGALGPAWPAGATVFLATTQPRLDRIDAITGDVLWSVELEGYEDPEDREGPISYSGPVLAGGRLLLTSTDGRLLSFDPLTGDRLSTVEMPDGSSTGVAVAGGTVYVLTDGGDLLAYR
ncbi:MAG: PQQ-binding-like beta-propeller repeat protein [Pseudomonadota bacterium]